MTAAAPSSRMLADDTMGKRAAQVLYSNATRDACCCQSLSMYMPHADDAGPSVSDDVSQQPDRGPPLTKEERDNMQRR